MRMGFSVKVERKKNLPAMSVRVHAAIAAEVKRSAEEIRDVAKSLAPVRTGALRDSLHVEQETEMEAEVVTDISYAIFQELGTVKMAARPFLTPASEEVRAKFEQRCTEAVRKAIGG